jgi:BRCA1-associated protein
MIGTDTYHIVIELDSTAAANDYRISSVFVKDINQPSELSMVRDLEPLKGSYVGEGVIRLYREFEVDEASSRTLIDGDDTMVCIAAVPTYFTATDLLGFLGKANLEHITHIRILKSEKPNRFLVLIKFAGPLEAAKFQHVYNGKAFNSMEPETCHALFVRTILLDGVVHNSGAEGRESSVIVDEEEEKDEEDLYGLTERREASLIPFLLDDPFTTTSREKKRIQDDIETERLVELPTCPVCLERMDSSVTGLLTIPCQHTFHCQCLSKWRDDSCPICRYSINVSNQKVRRSVRRLLEFRRSSSTTLLAPGTSLTMTTATTQASPGLSSSILPPVVEDHCSQCQEVNNLWICLICGNLGCDRYAPQQHSLNHFIATGHCFAMELETSRVWDYVGDNYVHRLVANESDGKLVELPEKISNVSPGNRAFGESGLISAGFGSNANHQLQLQNPKLASSIGEDFDKIDEVGFEYSQLLIDQLASQREHYEEILKQNGIDTLQAGASRQAPTNLPLLEAKVDELSDKLSTLTTSVIPKLEQKLRHKDDKITKLSRELNESTSLNEGLSSKVDHLTEANKSLELANQDLGEQVKDLMFFLETQEKFKDRPDDERDGQVVIQRRSGNSKSRRKKK